MNSQGTNVSWLTYVMTYVNLFLWLIMSVFLMNILYQCDYQPPLIISNPISQIANPGSRVEFMVKANGGKQYIWNKNQQPIDGGIKASLVLENITQFDEGSYTCLVTNSVGSVLSDSAELIVNDPPEIKENFLSQTVSLGQELILSGQVSGTEPFAYRIFHDGKLIGETSECYFKIAEVKSSDSGSWRFSVTNVTGVSVLSQPVEITVNSIMFEGEIEGEYHLEGEYHHEGELLIEGEVSVEGEAIIEGELSLEGEIIIEGEVSVEGEAIIEGELSLEGEAIIEGELEGEIVIEGEDLPPLCRDNFCLIANLNDNPISPLTVSFCEAFELLYDNAPRDLLGSYAKLIDYFTPQGDLNGYSWIDKTQGDELVTYQIGGNGIPDCSFEFKLLEVVLNDPNFCICHSGLNHKEVHEAWEHNMAKLSQDFAGIFWELASSLLPGFKQILCAYTTIGDGETDYSVENYVSANGSGGMVLGIAYLLGNGVANQFPDLETYKILPQFFGPQGDADGDGWTNMEEYSVFNASPEAYAEAVLNPEIVP